MKFPLILATFVALTFCSRSALGEDISPDLKAYLARCPGANDPKFVAAADRFIVQGKAAGWWQEMTAVYFFCAPTEQAALQNAKSDSLSLSVDGTVIFTPLTGIAGDGTTGSLDTKTPAEKIPGFTLDSHSAFVFCQTDNPTLADELGANGKGNFGIRVRNAVNASIWSGNRIPVQFKIASGRGLTGFVRNSPEGGFFVKNAKSIDFIQKPVSLSTSSLRYLRAGAGKYFSANQLAFGFLGSGAITKSQANSLYQSCVEMLNGLGTLTDDKIEKVGPPNAFARDSINQVTPKGLQVFRLAPVPPSNSVDFITSYPYGPLSDVIVRPWDQAVTAKDTQIGRWELIWSDRALGSAKGTIDSKATKGNDTMGVVTNTKKQQCRTEFNDYRKAIGSTLIKTAYSAGLKFRNDPDFPGHKGWGDIAEEWGYDVSPWQARWEKNPNDPVFTKNLSIDTGEIVHRAFAADPKNVDAFFHENAVDGVVKAARDHVILGQGRLCDMPMARGFVIDHEHSDNRPPELEVQFIKEMAEIAHCKKYLLGGTGHPANGGTGYESGWRVENANQILNYFDWFTIISYSATPPEGQLANLNHQYDFFKGPKGDLPVSPDKLCMQMQIGGPGQEVSTADAQAIRDFMVEKKIMRCLPSNVYATPGGPLSRTYNQDIAILLGLPRS